jgi:hypothetical protein
LKIRWLVTLQGHTRGSLQTLRQEFLAGDSKRDMAQQVSQLGSTMANI